MKTKLNVCSLLPAIILELTIRVHKDDFDFYDTKYCGFGSQNNVVVKQLLLLLIPLRIVVLALTSSAPPPNVQEYDHDIHSAK